MRWAARCFLILAVILISSVSRAELIFPTTSERDEAAAAVAYAVAETEVRIKALERDLADSSTYLIIIGPEGRIYRITDTHFAKLLAYVRLQYMADPAFYLNAVELVAELGGLPPRMILTVLSDPKALSVWAAEEALKAILRKEANKHRPRMEARLSELRDLLAQAKALQTEVANAKVERDAAPCPMLVGAPLDKNKGVFMKFYGDGRAYYHYPGEAFLCGYGTIHTSEFTGEHLVPQGEGYLGYFLDKEGKVTAAITYTKEGTKTVDGVVWTTGTWRNVASNQSGWYEARTFP